VPLLRGKPIDVVINSLTSSGMVSASLAALREGGGFAEISKRDIWSAQAAATDHPTVNYRLVATDFLSPQRLQVMLGRLSQSLHEGRIKPIACSLSGLIAVRECMREMSGGNHIGKVIVCAPSAPPGQDPEATVAVTGGLGTLGKLVASWSVLQGSRRLSLLGRSGRTSENPGLLLSGSAACVVMARSDSSIVEEAAFAVNGRAPTVDPRLTVPS